LPQLISLSGHLFRSAKNDVALKDGQSIDN
jgi:hypothetical protein